MTHELNNEPHAIRLLSRLLAFFAMATLMYPLFIIASLYGEWFLAWFILEHPPQPSLNDPKFIDGSSWMHPITLVAFLGFLPVACVALVLNSLYIIKGGLRRNHRILILFTFLILWLGTYGLLRWDPGQVVNWWFD